MQHQVHYENSRRAFYQFPAGERAIFQVALFILNEVGIVLNDVAVRKRIILRF